MSFILDALKKSETERQQQGQAEFAAVPTAPPQSSPARWLWILAALLVINIVILIGLLTRTSSNDNAAANASPETAVPGAPVAQMTETPSNFEQQVAAAIEAQPEEPEPSPVETIREQPATTNVDTPPVQNVILSNQPDLAGTATVLSSAPTSDSIPTIDQLRLDGSLFIDPMHLDIHVFNETAAERFVFINMTKYRENERTAEGPVIAEITRDGVILTHNSRRFLLPRE